MKQYKGYVIIVTYYGIKWINKCLSALAISNIVVKPIIMNNGSTHRATDFLLPFRINLQIVKTENILGFRKANNIAIFKAIDNGARYAFLLKGF